MYRHYSFPEIAFSQLPRNAVQGVASFAPDNLPPALASEFGAMDLSHLSPYNITFLRQLPPEQVSSDDVTVDADGGISVQGSPVVELPGVTAQRVAMLPPTIAPTGQYGDQQDLQVVLAALEGSKVLNRPSGVRLMLQVQNKSLVNSINIAFGKPASGSSLQIGPGGSSSYMNAVPQNDLWVFSTAGATVLVTWIDSTVPQAEHLLV